MWMRGLRGSKRCRSRVAYSLCCVLCCVLSPRHVHTDVHTDGAYLLLAGGARCVRGRVANCRADPMVASSSAAATDPLLFSRRAGNTAAKIASVSLPFICGALPRGHCAHPLGKSGALLSPLEQEKWDPLALPL